MTTNFSEPETLIVEIEGRRMHLACWGERDAPPLLLLHGMRDHARSWDWIAGALSANYRVYAPDLRGHGNSDWAEPYGYSVAAFVIDIADIVEALRLDRFAIVGHSFGGQIGLRYSTAWPEKVTAFCGVECIELPIIRDERSEPKPFPARLRTWVDSERARRQRRPRRYSTLADAEARIRKEQADLDPETISHLARHAVIANPDGSWRWKYDNATRLRAPDDADGRDLDQMLAAVACPVLLFYGDASWVPPPPPERLALLRNHRIITFPGVSHWLHHQARDGFTDAVRAFLATHHESKPHA